MVRIARRDFASRIATGAVAAFAASAVLPMGAARSHDGAHVDDGPTASADGPTDHLVEITGFEFQPARLQVRPGDTITWVNRDIAPHTATADDGSWDTGAIRTDESATVPVTPEMTATYYCRFHPMMTARFEIVAVR